MRRKTSFNLSSMGLLLVCLSIGFTATTHANAHVKYRDAFYERGGGLPYTIYEALLFTCAAAMVIGLGQQIMSLSRTQHHTIAESPGLGFAIFWRAAVGVILFASIALRIGLARGLLSLPKTREMPSLFYSNLIPEYLTLVCILVVLASSLGELSDFGPKKRSLIKKVEYMAALVLGFYALAQGMQICYLVYKAMAGIEAVHAPSFRRPGAYPDFQAEGFWLFWMAAAAAALSVVGSCALLSALFSSRKNRRRTILVVILGLLLMILSAGFGYWFVLVGMPTISPDFAEAGWTSTWWDWFEAATILAITVPVAAYRLTTDRTRSVQLDPAIQLRPVFHQSFLISVVLGTTAIFHGIVLLQYCLDPIWPSISISVSQRLLWMITDVNLYIPTAVSLLSLQVIWKQWKTPRTDHAIHITPINTKRYLLACTMLIAILVSSIPTIYAFGFAYWLSPWS